MRAGQHIFACEITALKQHGRRAVRGVIPSVLDRTLDKQAGWAMRASQNDSQGGYVEDPTTLAINLTYVGTLGLAVLMFLGLGVIIIITLVIAGIGRLVSVILMAMIGLLPKRDTTPIVHLPSGQPREPAITDAAGSAQVPSVAPSVEAPSVASPKRDRLGDARRRIASAVASAKDGGWKTKVDPRKLPKPAEVKSVVEHQTAHHPIVVAAAKEPPVLAKDWADAVAEADQRAAEREKSQKPPAIKVTVREVDGPAAAGANPGAKPATGGGKPTSGANKKSDSNTSKNGKSPSPIRKGSLSSASRNS